MRVSKIFVVLQVMGGSSKIGERALFSRDQVYVFGARMSRADLAYVLKINDKVQLELEELDSVILRFGVEIKYKASLVWVGPPPKLDENCDDFPHYVGNVVMPFITKRGFSIEEFTSLIKAQLRFDRQLKLSSCPINFPAYLKNNSVLLRVSQI